MDKNVLFWMVLEGMLIINIPLSIKIFYFAFTLVPLILQNPYNIILQYGCLCAKMHV